jgi:hypothetical protein
MTFKVFLREVLYWSSFVAVGVALMFVVSLLVGCATGARYDYRNGECSISIQSERELVGVEVAVDDGCAVTVSASKAGDQNVELMGKLIDKIPGVVE